MVAGFDTSEAYYEDSNPMNWVDGILRPTLLINSEDDMVCLPENIREDVVLDHGGALLLRTERGSHIAYNEGRVGDGVDFCYHKTIHYPLGFTHYPYHHTTWHCSQPKFSFATSTLSVELARVKAWSEATMHRRYFSLQLKVTD